MEAKSIAKYNRFAAQKARLVADQIRGLPVARALDLLAFSPRRAAKYFKKILESAIANAEHNQGADIDELRISAVFVDEAPTLKRQRARAKGRSTQILKRSCHITVKVSDESGDKN